MGRVQVHCQHQSTYFTPHSYQLQQSVLHSTEDCQCKKTVHASPVAHCTTCVCVFTIIEGPEDCAGVFADSI